MAKKIPPKEEEAREIIIAYASQTGTAQEIAKGIQADSTTHAVKTTVNFPSCTSAVQRRLPAKRFLQILHEDHLTISRKPSSLA